MIPSPAETTVENQTRTPHAVALACVGTVAVMAWLLGVGAAGTFSLFLGAIAFTAWYGGRWPSAVALFASILAVDVLLRTSPAVVVGPWTAFALSAVLVTWLIDRERRRADRLGTELEDTGGRLLELRVAERDARLLNIAGDRLSSMAPGAATFLVNRRSLVIGWPASATQMYARPAEQMLGTDAQLLFGSTHSDELSRIMRSAAASRPSRWSGLHRRSDGTAFDVDVEVQPVERMDAFTFAVRDLTRDRQWDAYRDAATRSDAALREEAELMRRQLAALESVTDPTIDTNSRDDIEQLLERLRLAIDADGVGFLLPAGIRKRLMTAGGLHPLTSVPRAAVDGCRSTQRLLLIQNDPARVAAASVLEWPDTVSCLIGIPIGVGGSGGGVLEVVNERPRRATDADMALIRVVANRVAAFGGDSYAHGDAVA